MVDIALAAGVDAIKLQIVSTEHLVSRKTVKVSYQLENTN
jgi:sialic acid synthase SpsE